MVSSGAHMAINVQVERNNSESSANVIRRFTKRVQSAGIVPKIRGNRYFSRTKSRMVQRSAKLRRLEKRAELDRLIRLGKAPEPRGRRR